MGIILLKGNYVQTLKYREVLVCGLAQECQTYGQEMVYIWPAAHLGGLIIVFTRTKMKLFCSPFTVSASTVCGNIQMGIIKPM